MVAVGQTRDEMLGLLSGAVSIAGAASSPGLEAEHEYERAVEQDHGNVFAWVRWAQCALELARMRRALHESTARAFTERAHAAVQQVLSVDPGHPIAVSVAHTLHLEFSELAAA